MYGNVNRLRAQDGLSSDRQSFSVVRYDPSTHEENHLFVYEVVSVPNVQQAPMNLATADVDVKPFTNLHAIGKTRPSEYSSLSNYLGPNYEGISSNDVKIECQLGSSDEVVQNDQDFDDEDDEDIDVEGDSDNEAEVVSKVGSNKSMSGRSRTEGWHICTHCSYTTNHKWSMTRHMKIHSDRPLLQCAVCQRTFKTQNALTIHARRHMAVESHPCHVCNQKFTRGVDLTNHLRIQHPDKKPHKCSDCVYETVEPSKLRRHMRLHTGDRPYQCPHCTYAAADSYTLKRHVQSHNDQKYFKCTLCQASFSQSASLTAHKQTHSSERPFACNKCPSSFSRSTDLRRHERLLHSSLWQYKCNQCQETLPDKYHYRLHIKTHNERNYKCSLCRYAGSSVENLENHVITKHGVK